MQISYTVTMNNKGQITIPAEIRREYGLHEKDSFKIIGSENGNLQLNKTLTIEEFMNKMAAMPKPQHKFSATEERELVGKALAEDDARIMKEWQNDRS